MGLLISLPHTGINRQQEGNSDSSVLKLLSPIIIGILFFLVALAFNGAVTGTIDTYIGDDRPFEFSTKDIVIKWVYAVIALAILVIAVYLSHKYVHGGNVNLTAHDNPVIGSPDAVANLPVEVI